MNARMVKILLILLLVLLVVYLIANRSYGYGIENTAIVEVLP